MTFQFSRPSSSSPRKIRNSLWLLVAAVSLLATGLPAYAATREITITAPTTAIAGSKVTITAAARTEVGNGERIGFFHADYSTDNGVTWTAISYSTNSGAKASYSATFTVKEAGSKAVVRVRVAYRGGKSGDVDFTGKAIDWAGSWNKWQEPPAKIVHIDITAK